MSTLIHYHDPKNILGHKKYILDTSLSILQNLQNIFPDGLPQNIYKVYLNDKEVDLLNDNLDVPTCEFDLIKVVRQQQGTELIVGIVVAVVAAVASYVLMPKPSIPNGIDEQKDSTNNQLQGQTNRARVYQAIPDIYGCVRVYPDLLKPANSEYIENIKYIDHLMCIGIGEYELERFKYDETLLDKISGTSYTVYPPYSVIPEIRYAYASDEVDGQELTPPNLSEEVIYEDTYEDIASYTEGGGTATITLNGDAEYWQNLNLPIQLNYIVNADVNSSYGKSTYKTNTDITYQGILTEVSLNASNQAVLKVESLTLLKYHQSIKGNITSTVFNKEKLTIQHMGGVYTDAFTLSNEGTEIWCDLVFARGLKGYVELQFIYWQIDELGYEIKGTRETYDWNIRENTYEAQYRTIKLKPQSGYGRYAVIIGRMNNGKTDLTDQIKVENVFIVGYNYNFELPNVTAVHIKTKATTQATSLKELKFNVEATRKTINPNNGKLTASRSFADAVLHSYVEIFNRDKNELDLDDLYAIDEKLKSKNEALGYFDFSFDDADISLGERIQTICNSARVSTYNDGIKWRFVRDEKKDIVSAMFTSANLLNTSEGGTLQYSPSQSESNDGVELEYIQASKDDRMHGTDKKAFIRLKIEDGEIVFGEARNPLKVQLAGCRNYSQAMNRAQLEIRRILYQRLTIEDEALYSDVALVNKGDLVRWSDNYDEAIVNGEIVGIDGHKFFVNQTLELDIDKSYRVTITDKQGYPSKWLDVTGFDNNSFTADFDNAFVADGVDIQCGSTFLITELITGEINDFILTEKQYNDNSFKISLSQYDERVYEFDATN